MWCDSGVEGILRNSQFGLLPGKINASWSHICGTSRQFYLYPWLQTCSQICSAQNSFLNSDLHIHWLLGTPPSCFIGTSHLVCTNLKSTPLPQPQICSPFSISSLRDQHHLSCPSQISELLLAFFFDLHIQSIAKTCQLRLMVVLLTPG